MRQNRNYIDIMTRFAKEVGGKKTLTLTILLNSNSFFVYKGLIVILMKVLSQQGRIRQPMPKRI